MIKPQCGEIVRNKLFKTRDVFAPEVGLVFQESRSQIVGNSVEEDLAFGLTVLQIPPGQIKEKVDL